MPQPPDRWQYEIATTMRYAEVDSRPPELRARRRVHIRVVRIGEEWVYGDFEIDDAAISEDDRSP
jgi:hypothetical protein